MAAVACQSCDFQPSFVPGEKDAHVYPHIPSSLTFGSHNLVAVHTGDDLEDDSECGAVNGTMIARLCRKSALA